MVELYLHSPIRLHGMVRNELNTGISSQNLSFSCLLFLVAYTSSDTWLNHLVLGRSIFLSNFNVAVFLSKLVLSTAAASAVALLSTEFHLLCTVPLCVSHNIP
jgi:hypothetical protein